MTDPLLDRAAVAALLGVSPDTISRYMTDGRFPPPDATFGRAPTWRESTITTWKTTRPGRGAGGGRPRKDTP